MATGEYLDLPVRPQSIPASVQRPVYELRPVAEIARTIDRLSQNFQAPLTGTDNSQSASEFPLKCIFFFAHERLEKMVPTTRR